MLKIFKKNKNKILFTLAMLFVYMGGLSLTIPGVNKDILNAALGGSSLINIVNMLGGGALQQMSIFALGVGPYITASIVIQLLSMDVIPYLAEQRKSGKKGQKTLDNITRYLGVVLAFIQGLGMSMIFDKSYGILHNAQIIDYVYVATIMTAGMMALLWIGDKITAKGIGNGVSLIIFAGIVSNMPTTLINLYSTLGLTTKGIIEFILYILLNIVIIFFVIAINLGERRIPIQNTNNNTVNNLSHLPLKINTASVVPVIFAQSILSAPMIVLSLINKEAYAKFSPYFSFEKPYMLILYAVLIIAFAYFYTHLQLNVDEIAENLKKGGSYVPGIRPGKDTAKYIKNIINKITIPGAGGLMILALIPYILPMITDIPSNIAFGGTGIIIVVGVGLETIKQLKTKEIKDKYKGFARF